MSTQQSWFSSHPPVMSKGGVPEAPAPYPAYQVDSQLPIPPSMPAADPSVPHASDRVIIPRKWVAHHEKKSLDDDDDDQSDDEDSRLKKDHSGKDKRGNYKCGRCGEPKKGHICRNKPRLRTAVVETAESEVQAELDPNHTVRQLSLHIQGYPESYGLTYTWTGMPFPQYGGRATMLPPYIPHLQTNQMQPMMGGTPQYPVPTGQGYPAMGMNAPGGMGGGQGMMMPPGSQQQQPQQAPMFMPPGQSKSHRHHHSSGQQDPYGGAPQPTQQYYA